MQTAADRGREKEWAKLGGLLDKGAAQIRHGIIGRRPGPW
jgi:hypothetical protein